MMNERQLSRVHFEGLIPHAGAMILIDTVESWTDKHITCRTLSHQQANHPLRLNGVLSAIHLLEYGAQTMAIHGGLLSGKILPGFLAAVRRAHFFIDHLDDVAGELVINAQAELKIQNGAVYQFTITDTHNKQLLDARTTVIYTL